MSFASREPDAAARMAEIIGRIMGGPVQHDSHMFRRRLELRKRRDLAALAELQAWIDGMKETHQ